MQRLLEALGAIPVSSLVVLIGLQFLTLAMMTYQWRRVSSWAGYTLPLKGLWEVIMRGTLVDILTPGAKIGGELARIYYLKTHLRLSGAQATLVVGLQKLLSISTFSILAVLGFIWLLLGENGQQYATEFAWGFLILLGTIGLVLALSAGRLPWPKSFGQVAQEMKKGFQSLDFSPPNVLVQVGLALSIWLLYGIKLVVLAHVLDLSVSWTALAAITYLTYMVSMVPISPGGLGTFEGAMIGLLHLQGVGWAEGLVLTLIFRFVTHWFPLIVSLGWTILALGGGIPLLKRSRG